jgi:hypothetical protein
MPNTVPSNVTASNALWCSRKIGNAQPLTHRTIRGRNAGLTSSTNPICAMARESVVNVGGHRFDRRPGTPTALGEYPPYRTRSAYPAMPTTSMGTPHERRMPSLATTTPSCHGAHQTAMTFSSPKSSTAKATGSSTAATPIRRSSHRHNGVRTESTR